MPFSPSQHPFEAVADACILFAELSSTFHGITTCSCPFSPTVYSFIESTYFLLIFLVHFIIVQLMRHNIHPLQSLVISTFVHWLESVMLVFSWTPYNLGLAYALPISVLRNVCLAYVPFSVYPLLAYLL